MSRTNIILSVIIALLIFGLWKSCDRNETGETVTVPIPEKTGQFEAVKPINTVIVNRVIQWRDNPTTANNAQVQNDTVNERLLSNYALLLKDYNKATDSIKTLKYSSAITPRDFAQTFENDTIKIDVSGKAIGTVESLSVKWKMKAYGQKVNMKTYKVLGGVELGANTKLDRFAAKANLIYAPANGKQYSIGYDNNGVIYAGLAITLFKHTK